MTIEVVEADGGYAQLINGGYLDTLGFGWILHMVYVEPERRGTGVGRRLLELVLERADTAGMIVTLGPSPDADCPIDVVAWYRRHGFEFTPSGMMMERQPTERMTA